MTRPGFFLLLVVLFISTSCAKKPLNLPANELPMYGGSPQASRPGRSDIEFNEKAVKDAGSVEAAVERIIQEAWGYENRGYSELAMMRFNQAWLLKPDHPEVFYGYAVLLTRQGKTDQAAQMYERALELNPNHAIMRCRLGRLYQNKAVTLSGSFWPAHKAEAGRYLNRALETYEIASRLAKKEEDLSYIYYEWAVCLAVVSDFKGAWEKIHLSRRHGGQFIQSEFIQMLSKDMPDPSP